MTDKYNWLRDKNWPTVNNPEILAHLNAENALSDQAMLSTLDLQEQLYQELKGRIQEEDESYPVKKENYYYFSRVEKDKDYPIFLRKLDGKEELLLDVNLLSAGKSSFALGDSEISHDHHKMAYSYDEDGSERYCIYVRDLQTQQDLGDLVENSIGAIVWNKAGSGFYYTAVNESWRADRVFFHQLGTKQQDDILIYQEKDQGFHLGIGSSSSEEYLLLETGNSSSNETWVMPLEGGDLKLAIKRHEDHLYSVDHMDNIFYLLTNDQGKNFRLVSLTDDFDLSKSQEIIAHSADDYLIDIAIYNQYLVVSKRVLGLNKIEYYHLASSKLAGAINFDEEVYEANVSYTNKNDQYLRISYSSLTKPKSVLEYDFAEQQLYTRKTDIIPSGYNAALYTAKRLWVTSLDGTKVPISMVYRQDALNSPNKLLLYGYGSYGYGMPMSFRPNIISLLDRGFIYVIAHIRGGDELGFNWYESAKFLTKNRTFEDFIAVAEYLIEHNYTSAEKLAIMGGSAGGMLVGTVINRRPELFKSAIALVPFVDVLNTMLDETLPLTPGEFEEWGNPIIDQEYYEYIKSYSPYDNVTQQKYPHLLVTASLNDPRVGYWEAAKWVAKLKELKTDDHLLLFKTEMDSGHKGQSGRFNALKEIAMIYSFFIMSLDN